MEKSVVDVQRSCSLAGNLYGCRLEDAYLQPSIAHEIHKEAATPNSLVTPEMVEQLEEYIFEKDTHTARQHTFFSTEKVVIVPGLLASSLSDVSIGGQGLIWINRDLYRSNKLGFLQLNQKMDADANPNVKIQATAAIPLLYDILRLALEIRRYATSIFPVDWRTDLTFPAEALARLLKTADKPVNLIAHSQGALVARLALQIIGEGEVAKRVKKLVLLGPANRGSFSAVTGLLGDYNSFGILQKIIVEPPNGFQKVFSSMPGMYQLLPWKFDGELFDVSKKEFWDNTPVDYSVVKKYYGWSKKINTEFFNSKIYSVIGDYPTIGDIKLNSEKILKRGDGTISTACAVLPNTKSYYVESAEHSMLPTYRKVIGAVVDILADRAPSISEISSSPSDYY